MNLGQLVALENGVDQQNVLLLRHGNRKVESLLQAGGTIEEYTLVQPTGSKYDFHAANKPPIQIVVVIVNDAVFAVYHIMDVEAEGTTRNLTSPAFALWDIEQGYPELNAKRFSAEVLSSRSLGRAVVGWRSKRNAVARYGSSLYGSVEI